jgi:hypothetical protein
MKRNLTIVILALISFVRLQAQTTEDLTGAQVLRAARAIYDQGRLHELPVVLETAVKRKGKNQFSESEKIEAYKLLVLTYIYLEEPLKADEKMIELLRTDHFFEISDSDPVEFKSLYKKFRTRPLFRIGLRLGLNRTYASAIKNYYVMAESKGKGAYVPNLAFQGGISFEKDFKKKFVINPELFYSIQSFNYSNTEIYIVDSDSLKKAGSADHTITHTKLQLNLLMQYKLATSKFFPYIAAGPAIGYLIGSSFEGKLIMDNKDQITGGSIDNKEKYHPLSLSVIVAGGIRYKVGSIYLSGDVRYQYGLHNVVNGANRYKADTPELNELITSYSYIDNDFSINQFMFNFGLIYPVFSPKKMIK